MIALIAHRTWKGFPYRKAPRCVPTNHPNHPEFPAVPHHFFPSFFPHFPENPPGEGSGITTEILAASEFQAPLAPFYYAEDYHQQYLAKPGARRAEKADPVVLPLIEEASK